MFKKTKKSSVWEEKCRFGETECLHCGKTFALKRVGQSYCSKECYERHYIPLRCRARTLALRDFHRAIEMEPTPEEMKAMGVRLPESGEVECLKCGKKFESPDRKKIRICVQCRTENHVMQTDGWQHLDM